MVSLLRCWQNHYKHIFSSWCWLFQCQKSVTVGSPTSQPSASPTSQPPPSTYKTVVLTFRGKILFGYLVLQNHFLNEIPKILILALLEASNPDICEVAVIESINSVVRPISEAYGPYHMVLLIIWSLFLRKTSADCLSQKCKSVSFWYLCLSRNWQNISQKTKKLFSVDFGGCAIWTRVLIDIFISFIGHIRSLGVINFMFYYSFNNF